MLKVKDLIYNTNKILTNNNSVYNARKILNDYYQKYDKYEIQKYKIELQKNNIKPYYYNKKILFENNNFELVLINWGEYSSSLIHDHSENGCLSVVLEGKLTEYLFDKDLYLKNCIDLYPGEINFIDNNKGYHKIKNNYKYFNNKSINEKIKELDNTNGFNFYFNNSLSLHIYSPPNHNMEIFQENINSLKNRKKIEKETENNHQDILYENNG